ncbi:hypothetical protein VD0004_g9495 [Verticillium dahliae]|uniref:non-specific serine/threonine protein kinase n=1 Tax=Verticillium dahliae TaxID=27337 RepID=A0A444S4Q3_VERDA|nr:hypothetical protein VD0004_g9495 [Verticillium dahliae]PNH62283.1 hypothetical protein VD0001_g9488 [Verticillium dahliae]RXG48393.1 hypothetical protein VDGE_07697 [Verticillium dahliae]
MESNSSQQQQQQQQPPPHQPQPSRHLHLAHLHALIPPPSTSPTPPLRTAASTPMSSPGLFSPSNPRPRHNYPGRAASDSNTPVQEVSSPYLHPLQHHKVRETHKALIDSDSITGRKLINQYEVIEEIGRGMHGKVKLARNIETNDNVAIKIIPRYSKRRRLGKVAAMSPQDKTMREIAILKKMRHPNVVSLLEIIDDPELKKIYLILEHVELGEVVWRKKGLPHICMHERRRIEREMRGEAPTPEEEQYDLFLERRQAIKDLKRAKMSQANAGPHDYWSIEHGIADDGSNASQSRVPSNDDLALFDRLPGDVSLPSLLRASRATSRAPSRTQSVKSMNQPPPDLSASPDGSDMETPGPLRSSNQGSSAALDGTMYGAYIEERAFRGRSPSMADSIISHMSSIDWNPRTHDPFADDFSYVPCFTLEQARSVFRDTVLGLEYLHYQGVVHRDIKPANLLWTKDHRVKISDFGVSYFGRPIRDGEPDDEAVSESEAQDFDDDLELAKTVGTPAFFAPELCYTDTDRVEQPRISEQIDIWSLGVTLYCLVFARIPFQAEDEWAMFKKIATEDVFIPRQRLRPVDPSTSPDENSLYKRQNKKPYRDDNDLVYEEIDNLLYDLLRLMFTKSPDKRVRLRDIKRHPWVVQGISNPIAWIDETDPARPSQGRRVQVDAKETAHAVVPITFLERARSVVKKAVGKVMHPLVSERGDSRSRRRATSSVASSAGESNVPHAAVPITNPRDLRRKSLKSDEYFAGIYSATPDHPLSQSVEASPSDSAYDPLATAIAQPSQSASSSQKGRSVRDASNEEWPASYDSKKSSASVYRPANRQPQTTTGNNFLALTAASTGSQTVPSSPAAAMYEPKKQRYVDQHGLDDTSRSHSVDRSLFASADKRAAPQVGLSNAMAPGTVHRTPSRPRPVRSVDLGKAVRENNPSLASPLFFSSQAITGYQHGQPHSDSNILDGRKGPAMFDERPATAHRRDRPQDVPDGKTPSPRSYNTSTPESFARAKEGLIKKQVDEYQRNLTDQLLDAKETPVFDPADIPCPPSPDDENPPPVSRGSTMETGKLSRSASMAGLTTPLTSPSEVASPMSSSACPSKEQMLVFHSDPSLPALLSGASSVSADQESEPVDSKALSGRPNLLETTDSLTPPAFAKEPVAGFPIEHLEQQSFDSGVIAVQLDVPSPLRSFASTPEMRPADDDDDDSDSDGIFMFNAKKKKAPAAGISKTHFEPRRRDTNASIASTETAKRYAVNETSSQPE